MNFFWALVRLGSLLGCFAKRAPVPRAFPLHFTSQNELILEPLLNQSMPHLGFCSIYFPPPTRGVQIATKASSGLVPLAYPQREDWQRKRNNRSIRILLSPHRGWWLLQLPRESPSKIRDGKFPSISRRASCCYQHHCSHCLRTCGSGNRAADQSPASNSYMTEDTGTKDEEKNQPVVDTPAFQNRFWGLRGRNINRKHACTHARTHVRTHTLHALQDNK